MSKNIETFQKKQEKYTGPHCKQQEQKLPSATTVHLSVNLYKARECVRESEECIKTNKR